MTNLTELSDEELLLRAMKLKHSDADCYIDNSGQIAIVKDFNGATVATTAHPDPNTIYPLWQEVADKYTDQTENILLKQTSESWGDCRIEARSHAIEASKSLRGILMAYIEVKESEKCAG